MNEYGKEVDKTCLSGYTEYSGYGVSVNKNDKLIIAGNHKLMEKNEIAFTASEKIGTVVYVAVDKKFAGSIIISDEIKPDSFRAVSALRERGVQKIIMLTGDSPEIAQETARELGLDESYGGLLPHEKVEKIESLVMRKSAKRKLAFTGDGINDAPVLAIADIGIAMGGIGSDATIEAADVVLMTDEPSKLANAVDIARFTKRAVWQNIVFALGVKIVFLGFGAFGIASMWEAVFADVGVCLITVLNAMRIIGIKDS
jgi:Cd2+/Zn2+-exporting ATPase